MIAELNKTPIRVAVMDALRTAPEKGLTAKEITGITHVARATLGVVIEAFKQAGWVSAEWTEVDPNGPDRPARRWSLTEAGKSAWPQ